MKILCSCHVLTKKKNCLLKDESNGKAFAGRKRYVDNFLSSMLNARSMQDNSTQLAAIPLNLMCQEKRLKHFSFSK